MEQTTGRNSRPLEHREEVIETCAGPETVVNPKTRQDPETAVYEIKCLLDKAGVIDAFSIDNNSLNAFCELSGKENSDKIPAPSTTPLSQLCPLPIPNNASPEDTEALKRALEQSKFKPVNWAAALNGPDEWPSSD